MKLYSLKCKSLKLYNVPFTAADDGAAVAGICASVQQCKDAPIVQQIIADIDDFSLFTLGEFDSKNGVKNARPKLVTELASVSMLSKIVKEVVEGVQKSV